jgi:geranylgeranyl diphosphate synthase type II
MDRERELMAGNSREPYERFDLKGYLAKRRDRINEALTAILEKNRLGGRLQAAMKYSLMAGGKRIRPVLCMAASEAVGEESGRALKAGCALEMIHTYSLIHDDLPAMDDDGLRRGIKTCHIAFDEATAILAGDALLTLAFETLSGIDCKNGEQSARLLKVIRRISEAAGWQGMVEGQMRDMESEGKLLNRQQLDDIHRHKTGAMIQASVEAGAILGEGGNEEIECLKTYAGHIGLAFQVADDILNVSGDPKRLGKSVGTDQHRMKNTYPSVMGLEESKRLAETMVEKSIKALESFDEKAAPLRTLARYIIERTR